MCPKCKSNNIYKRTLSPIYTEKSKKRGISEIGDAVNGDASKKYRCVVCKNEFDVPIVE